MNNVKLSNGDYVNLDAIPYFKYINEEEVRLTIGVNPFSSSNIYIPLTGEDAKKVLQVLRSANPNWVSYIANS